MDAVAKGGGAILGHVLVGAQNMLLLILSAGRVGAGPRRTELAGWLVLICEEGLEAPINTQFRNCYAPMCSQRRDTDEGRGAAYLAIAGQVDLQGLGVVFEAERRHGEEDVLAIDRLALLLVAFLRGYRVGVSGDSALERGGMKTYLPPKKASKLWDS